MYLNQSNEDLNSPTPTEEAKEEEEEWPAEEPISGRSKIHFGAQFGGYERATTQLFSLRLVQDATKGSTLLHSAQLSSTPFVPTLTPDFFLLPIGPIHLTLIFSPF